MREEIAYLRSKVDELEAHLKVLQQIKTLEVTFVDETPWQKTANDMRIAKKAALHVNSKLRHELQEQIEFGKALQTLMAKRPRLTMLPSLDGDQWQILKLVKNPQLRQQAIHEICERQYQLTQVALVEGGIFDRVGEFEAYTPRLAKTNADLVVQAAYCTTKQFDFQVMSEMAWKVFEGCLGAKNSNLTSHTLKTLDQNAVYVRKEKHWNDLLNQANCLYKRYREPHRDVIVCRTILEDEEIPFHPGALVMNKSAWLVLEKLDGGKACRLKYFQKSTLPMVQSNFGTKNLVDRAETSRYYRVGNVTNAVLLSLQNLIRDVSVTLRLLVDNYTGNIDDTFELVNLTTPHDESFDVVSMIADGIDLFIPTSNGYNPLNAPGPASDSPDSQKRPKCVNLSRKRQRDEIEYLRIKVVEMEKHLTTLRKDKPEKSSTTERAVGKTVWQAMAKSLEEAAQSAMIENETLKEQLQQQIEFGKSLHSLLTKRPQLTLLPTLISDQWKVKRFPVDPVIRKQLATEICQQQYNQISTMLRELPMQLPFVRPMFGITE
ncbi:unnamed protein product [Aphanomyces euteiches]